MFFWDAVTVDNMQIDPETNTVAQSGLQVYSLNSDLKAAVPSKSQVSLFFGGGGVTVDVHIDTM
jgi:hypothetical protein